MVKKLFKRLYTILIFLFLYAPIIVLIVFSFNATKSTAHWEGFSLKWYTALFQDRQIMKALNYTLIVAIVSSVISTVVGTLAAYGIYRMRPRYRKWVMTLNHIPILNPDIVTG